MQKLRRWLSISLIISMAFLLPMNVYGQTTPAQVKFVASPLDANNNFTVTMTISNATFNVIQFALRYDVTKIQPIDKITDQITTNFANFAEFNADLSDRFSSTHLKLDNVLGFFEFTNYLNPEENFSFGSVSIDRAANIGINELELYTFHFRLLSNENPHLELAKIDPIKPYNDTITDGWGIALGSYRVSANVFVDLSKVSGNTNDDQYLNPEPILLDTPTSIEPPNSEVTPNPQEQVLPIRPTNTKERLKDTLILQIGNYAAFGNGELCHIYPGEKLVTPYIKDQRTFVPIRFIAEKLGIVVTWDDSTKTVQFTKDDEILTLTIGEKQYNKNQVFYNMDTAAELQWDRTMVPVRFVAEALGYAVEWNTQLNMVYITEVGLPWLLEDPVEQQATNEVTLLISPLVRDFVRRSVE